ncbi:MAG: RIP metalloprotease RseP [Lachnospiraceae bacterium]
MTGVGIILSILAFSLLIVSHEFGHFIVAKKCGVYVEEFSIGFGPSLVSWQGEETKYSIKLIPFGGSCAMLGEDESMADERAFTSKNVFQRMAILFAGPFFNFILAFILAVIVIGCMGVDEPVLSEVMEGYPAQEAGMQAGDRITRLNDENIHVYRDISLYLALHQGENLDVVYERDGQKYETVIVPKFSDEYQSYMMGIVVNGTRTRLGPIGTLKYSAFEVGYWIRYTFTSLKMLIRGRVGLQDMSGPVGMVSSMTDMVKESSQDGIFYIFINLANICILLSANLGVMNLLPIPALDGGRLLFCLIELVRGKPVDQEKEAAVHTVGILLLFALMFVIMFKDIWQIFV